MGNKQKVYAIILAGGKGTRLRCTDCPKVLIDIAGRSILRYVYDAVKKVADEVVIITGFHGEKIEQEMKGEPVKFAHQTEQLGTAHAALQAEKLLKNKDGIVLIVNGDHPLIDAGTLRDMVAAVESGLTLAVGSAVTDLFSSYGRILRDENGKITGEVEVKDATPGQSKIKEKNVGFYAAQSQWLWKSLKRVKKSPVSGEYYITELLNIALQEGTPVDAVKITNINACKGVNTPEELKEVEKIIKG